MMGSYLVDTPDECRVVEDDCVLHKLDCPPEASNQQCSDSIVAGKYKQKKGKNWINMKFKATNWLEKV